MLFHARLDQKTRYALVHYFSQRCVPVFFEKVQIYLLIAVIHVFFQFFLGCPNSIFKIKPYIRRLARIFRRFEKLVGTHQVFPPWG